MFINLTKEIMKKYSKRINNLKQLLTEKMYSVEQAIPLVKKIGTAKFVESVEAHISLNIDPKYANQQLRTSLVLPNGTGKSLRIAVFTETEYVPEALNMGATIAGSDDLIEEISAGKLDFDLLITTPQLMPKLAKLGRVLGPKGLMPSPKSGTVTQNLKETINEFKKGKLEYRADKTGIVHLNFGKVNFSEEQLIENLFAVYNSIEKNKPTGVKGRYFKSFNICTTMSPGVTIELNSFKKK
jgi:large subunit ribosomal protein L1